MIQNLNLSVIVTDAGTQSRAELSTEAVDDYAASMRSGVLFPPIIVYFNGEYLLADGFHRLAAAEKAGRRFIRAEVREGSRLDALLHSLKSNHTHGLRRSNADKRFSVTIALSEFSGFSSRSIAEVCGVSHQMVTVMRGESGAPASRKGRDGKNHPSTNKRFVRLLNPESAVLRRLKYDWRIAHMDDRRAFLIYAKGAA